MTPTPDALRQLNLRDPRVQKWYDDAADHSESGRCTNEHNCPGCKRLMRRNAELRAIPGLLGEVGDA